MIHNNNTGIIGVQMSSELGPMFSDARIVGVISDAVKEKRYVVVAGPRDVGKSLYIRLVATRLISCPWREDIQTSRENIREDKNEYDKYSNESKEDELRYFIPIFVLCEDAARIARLNYAELMYQGEKIKLEPVIFIDNAHLCKEVDVDKGRIVRIYPTQYYVQRGMGGSDSTIWIYVFPFRFVEVAELVGYPLPDIRRILSEKLKHYRGEDRLNNLMNPERICDIIKSFQGIIDLSRLDKLFRLYALYGGTAYGIELIYRALRFVEAQKGDKLNLISGEGKLSYVLSNYMKTIDEVLEDAEALGVDKVATKYLLYYLSSIGDERKGLEVDLKKMYEKVADKASKSLGVNIKTESVKQAFSYLWDSFIVAKFTKSKEGGDEGGDKLFFTDPRYFLGAYLKRHAEEEPEHHVSAFINEVGPCILGDEGDECDWVSYYFEGLALLNVAFGVYAINASNYKQKYYEKFDKYLKYIKFYDETNKSEMEIDGQFYIRKGKQESVKGLFELSMSYDGNHVNKCERALKQGLGKYCIYAVLDHKDVECKNVDGRYIITAPLPLALLLF